jgi:hypothetical protein
LILFAIMMHIQKEMSIGLHYLERKDMEDVKKALDRIQRMISEKMSNVFPSGNLTESE